MNYTYLHYQTSLGLLHGFGPKRVRKVTQNLDTLESLFTLSPSALSTLTGLKPSLFANMQGQKALEQSDAVIAYHQENKISSLFYSEDRFPQRLNHCEDGPNQLFLYGDIDLNNKRFVAIVGTRDATTYGQALCKELIASFVGKDIVVVSGLAYGIDAWAHHYCIEFGVPTIAVLGHGLDRIYPSKHKALAAKIKEQGGLISEFIPNTKPDRENFPKRNRIVAGMCDATIVVESKVSGGSLITAELANDYNRDVFAFPGNVNCPTSQGCNQLIASNKAHLLKNPDDFLIQMGWTEEPRVKPSIQRKIFTHLNEIQQSIIAEIRKAKTVHIDTLSLKLSLPMSNLNVELFNLELEGVVKALPGSTYEIIE